LAGLEQFTDLGRKLLEKGKEPRTKRIGLINQRKGGALPGRFKVSNGAGIGPVKKELGLSWPI